jgi:hypothetical protein
MPEDRSEEPAEHRAAPPADLEPAPVGEGPLQAPPASPLLPRPAGAARRAALWLAVLLVVVTAGIALSPYWAPNVASLLPWKGTSAPVREDFADLAARVTALEQRPAPTAVGVDAIKAAQAALEQRVARLEAAIDALRQNQGAAAATKASLAQLTQRLDAIDAQAATRAAAEAADARKTQQEQSRLGGAATDLGDRLTQLERQVQAQGSADRSGTVLLLALLQMREAVEEARPFPAEYSVFERLAHDDAKLAAAAEPLAGAAREGVASRAVLSRRLADLSAQIATAKPPAAKSKWWAQALDRMRALVTIRRIDGGAKTGPEAAVDAAQSALARGDLAAAVSALDPLTAANAETARPWVQMARKRLAAEAALTHLQELVAARLGAAPGAPPPTPPAAAPAPNPGAAPVQPSATPRTPS